MAGNNPDFPSLPDYSNSYGNFNLTSLSGASIGVCPSLDLGDSLLLKIEGNIGTSDFGLASIVFSIGEIYAGTEYDPIITLTPCSSSGIPNGEQPLSFKTGTTPSCLTLSANLLPFFASGFSKTSYFLLSADDDIQILTSSVSLQTVLFPAEPIPSRILSRERNPVSEMPLGDSKVSVELADGRVRYSLPVYSFSNVFYEFGIYLNYRGPASSSGIAPSIPLGSAWRFNFQYFLTPSGSDYVLIDSEGDQHRFVLAKGYVPMDTKRWYVDSSKSFLVLLVDATTKRLYDSEGKTIDFDDDGYPTSMSFGPLGGGKNIVFTYNAQHRVTSISLGGTPTVISLTYPSNKVVMTCPDYGSTTINYSQGRVTSVLDCEGRTWNMGYATVGRDFLTQYKVLSSISIGIETISLSYDIDRRCAGVIYRRNTTEFLRHEYSFGAIATDKRTMLGDSDCCVANHYQFDENGDCESGWEDVALSRKTYRRLTISEKNYWIEEEDLIQPELGASFSLGEWIYFERLCDAPCFFECFLNPTFTTAPYPIVVEIEGLVSEVWTPIQTEGFSYGHCAVLHPFATLQIADANSYSMIRVRIGNGYPLNLSGFARIFFLKVEPTPTDFATMLLPSGTEPEALVYSPASSMQTTLVSHGMSYSRTESVNDDCLLGSIAFYRYHNLQLLFVERGTQLYADLSTCHFQSGVSLYDVPQRTRENHFSRQYEIDGVGAVENADPVKTETKTTYFYPFSSNVFGSSFRQKIRTGHFLEPEHTNPDFVFEENIYYDALGRVVGKEDRLGHKEIQQLDSCGRVLTSQKSNFRYLFPGNGTVVEEEYFVKGPVKTYDFSGDHQGEIVCSVTKNSAPGSLAIPTKTVSYEYDDANHPISVATNLLAKDVDYVGSRVVSNTISNIAESRTFSGNFCNSLSADGNTLRSYVRSGSSLTTYSGANSILNTRSTSADEGTIFLDLALASGVMRESRDRFGHSIGVSKKGSSDLAFEELKTATFSRDKITKIIDGSLETRYSYLDGSLCSIDEYHPNNCHYHDKISYDQSLEAAGASSQSETHVWNYGGNSEVLFEEIITNRVFRGPSGRGESVLRSQKFDGFTFRSFSYKDPSGRAGKSELDSYATGGILLSSYLQEFAFYSFADSNTNYESSLPISETFQVAGIIQTTISYSYDSCGRIASTSQGNETPTSFVYDSSGRLISESLPQSMGGATRQYFYDNHGNLVEIRDNSSSVLQLAYFSTNDQISSSGYSYDSSGYPTLYAGMTISWDSGRPMAIGEVSLSYDGTKLAGYTSSLYSSSFHYRFNRLDEENIVVSNVSHVFRYVYGADGSPVGFVYNENFYAYQKNLFGDVIAIWNNSVRVASYRYSGFGECVVLDSNGSVDQVLDSVGNLNPYRYRGYRFIQPLEMYATQSRIYDPIRCRFLSPDREEFLNPNGRGGTNAYCYCLNDPINRIDPLGCISILLGLILAGAIIGAISYTVSRVVTFAFTKEWSWSWGQFIGSVLGGAIGGAFAATNAGPFLVGFITGFSSNIIGMNLQNVWEGTHYSDLEIVSASFAAGIVAGTLTTFMDSIHMQGITSGKNSYKAIMSSVIRKRLNGVISSISVSTFAKMIAYTSWGSFGTTIANGVLNATDVDEKIHQLWLDFLDLG